MVSFLLPVLKIEWYQSRIPLEPVAVWSAPELHSALATAKWMLELSHAFMLKQNTENQPIR